MALSAGPATRRRSLGVLGLIVGLSVMVVAGLAGAVEAPVGLGTAKTYAVLAGTTVTNTGPSVINGDVGVSPGSGVTGFPPGMVNGSTHAADAEALQAQKDLKTAYDDAAGRAPTTTYSGTPDLGGTTLTSGVYKSASSFAITGTVTLDAQGDPNSVFIFEAGSTLVTAPDGQVALINGAQACNVFWQVGSSATLDVRTKFVGTILALTSITANTDAVVEGRLLARNGATTLDTNTVTAAVCAATTTTTVPAATTTVPGTTIVPATTTTVPSTSTTTAPAATTTVPATTTTVPATTTTVPAPTTTVPATTTTVPATTTTVPATTTTVPATTTTTSLLPPLLPTTTTAPATTTTTRSSTTTSSSTTTRPTATTTTRPSATTTTRPSTTTTRSSTTTTRGSTATTGGGGIATSVKSRALPFTGGGARGKAFAGGLALALGSLIVLLVPPERRNRRRQRSDAI